MEPTHETHTPGSESESTDLDNSHYAERGHSCPLAGSVAVRLAPVTEVSRHESDSCRTGSLRSQWHLTCTDSGPGPRAGPAPPGPGLSGRYPRRPWAVTMTPGPHHHHAADSGSVTVVSDFGVRVTLRGRRPGSDGVGGPGRRGRKFGRTM